MAPLMLRLYVAGRSVGSLRAEQNLRLLEAGGNARLHVEIIDVMERPDMAESAGIIATPTLSLEDGNRPRRIVGDLSDLKRVAEFLGIELERNGQ